MKINGKRLKMARIYRGLTTKDLAEKIGCQRQTISMYENNLQSNPSESIISKISKELNFPFRFFYEKNISFPYSSVYFRSLLTTTKKYREEVQLKLDFINIIYDFLKEYIIFPKLDLPNFNQENLKRDPEKTANLLREYWNLGNRPIENIIYEVEKHGILVSSFSTNNSSNNYVDALSKRIDNGAYMKYLIAYSNNKTSAARIHFDIAHELGHICLHLWDIDSDELEESSYFKEKEREANKFASAFLLPRESFKKDVENTPLNISGYIELKNKWHVSIQAMLYRAFDLKVINIDEYQLMIRRLQKNKMRRNEPLDDILLTRQPSLLKTAVLILLNENVFTAKSFMDELASVYNFSIMPEDIENLLNLPKETLSQSKIIYFQNLRIRKNL